MAILLLILKIIGITLLVILGLILFLILMVFFYPIGYRVRGEWQEELKVKVSAGWLLSIVHVTAAYEDGDTRVVVRLFGIPVMRVPKPERLKKTKKPKKMKQPRTAETIIPTETVEAEKLPEAFENVILTAEPQKKMLPEEADIEYNETDEAGTFDTQKKRGFIERIKAKIQHLLAKIQGIGRKIRGIGEKFKGIKEKLRSLRNQAGQVIGLFRDDGNKRVVKLIWKEFVGLMKRYRPRRVKADVNYAAGDPARTGQVLGGLAMLPFLYTQKVSIVPDFESEEFYVNGSWDMKGHIQVFPLVRTGLRIYKNQDVKKLIKQLREREEG